MRLPRFPGVRDTGSVLILLPPSETKSPRRRGAMMDLARLSWSDELTEARRTLQQALVDASALPDAVAALGVPPTREAEVRANLDIADRPATPVTQLYTGVLYDALDLASLAGPAKARAQRWLVVVSAAYGALRMGDKVGSYRLAMDVDLPPLGPLARWWAPRLADPLGAAAGTGLVVDCRSTAYANAWKPTGAQAERWLRVSVPGASHMAKHTRGLVARAICAQGSSARTPAALAEELSPFFTIELTEPNRAGQPWDLACTARAGTDPLEGAGQ